mmetsp:Transcript_114/g.105  ORF Transcript_114/g.105 Transcript_114/m.105 type:complete len:208 (+) Transcript_114:413-1036(+)
MANAVSDHIKYCELPDGLSILSGSTFHVVSCKASALSESRKFEIFTLLESNMMEHYQQAWGWDRETKWKEMFSSLSNYILIVDQSEENERNNEGDLIAFLHYQFTWDDEEEPEYAVIFCYELQIHIKYQKQGIGRFLMNILSHLCIQWKMKKIMLTVFKSNQEALLFYQKIGFKTDVNSPSKWGHEVLYEILSCDVTDMNSFIDHEG